MFATRRVSPAYKDVPGGQILGATKDYTQRLLDFDLDGGDDPTADWDLEEAEPESLRNVLEILREEGLLAEPSAEDDGEDYDTTREPLVYPAPRSAILQELARGETGAITALGYSTLRVRFGPPNPRRGSRRLAPRPNRTPYTGDPVEVTSVEVSECESVVPEYESETTPSFPSVTASSSGATSAR